MTLSMMAFFFCCSVCCVFAFPYVFGELSAVFLASWLKMICGLCSIPCKFVSMAGEVFDIMVGSDSSFVEDRCNETVSIQ